MKLNAHPQNVRSTLLAYIGNTLSESDREDFDRRLLEDEIFSQQVEEAEFALVEEYASQAMPAEDRAVVEPWIAGSPQRQEQTAITAALRHFAKQNSVIAIQKPHIIRPWMWVCAAAACIALLVALPLRHQRQPAVPIVAELHHLPAINPTQAIAEDTILLEAQRLRGNGISTPPPNYTVHADAPTRIQIIVPQGAASVEYSLDIRQSTVKQTSAPIHFEQVKPKGGTNFRYIEFSLPAGSLVPGSYEAELRSMNGTYRLQFSISDAK